MPLYDYSCKKCGTVSDIWAKIEEYDLFCPFCGETMHRMLSPTNIICDIKPYLDGHMAQNPVPIYSRQHKNEELKKRGLFIK